MKKTILLFLISLSFFVGLPSFAQDQNKEEPILNLYFFYSPTCPHCHAEHSFLDEIESKYLEVNFYRYIAWDTKYKDLLSDLLKKHDIERFRGVVPLTFINNDYFIGFDSDKGKMMEVSIQNNLNNLTSEKNNSQSKIKVPIIGEISKEDFSLPVLAILLGFLDGFNVCSLGALMLILGLVLTLQSRKKIMLYGGIFLGTTALVYGALIILWHQLFVYLSLYIWVMELAIAFVGLIGGAYFIKEFIRFKKHGLTCDSSGKIISNWSEKIESQFKEKKGWLSLAGIVLVFASIVTIVEFPCSAAVPVMFAGILSQADLSQGSYFLYIALFMVFYLLDEIIVFLIASWKLSMWMTSNSFVIWAVLAEGLILLAIGSYYLISLIRIIF